MNQQSSPQRLLTWKQLKEDFGIPFCREHARRLEKKEDFLSGFDSAHKR
jgi:hypothetical protein